MTDPRLCPSNVIARVAVDILASDSDIAVVLPKKENAQPVFLTRLAFDVLRHASTFASIPDHATRYRQWRGLPDTPHTIDTLHRILHYLQDVHLLSSSDNLRTNVHVSQTTTNISTVGIVTKDRPESLARCLTSLFYNFRSFSRSPNICVYDDSIDNASELIIKSLIETDPSLRSHIRYAGLQQKQRFVKHLLTRFPLRAQSIITALTNSFHYGPTFGANLNCLLLDTIGECILTIDDDVVVGQIGVRTDQQEGIALSSDPDPTEFWFYQSRENAFEAVRWTEYDLLGAHERLLGKSLSEVLCQFSDANTFIERAGLEGAFPTCANAKIVCTMMGIAGSSGSQHNCWFRLQGPSRDRLLASDDLYSVFSRTDAVVRCARRYTVSEGAFFMNTAAGLDNRTPLPPFLPVMRNMDSVFGCLLRRLSELYLIGHLPWLIRHDPMALYPPSRTTAPPMALRVSDLMIEAINSCNLKWVTPNALDRLPVIGECLQTFGSMSPPRFEAWLIHTNLEFAARQISTYYKQLRIPDRRNTAWHQDIRQHLRDLQASMRSRPMVRAADVSQTLSQEESTRVTQTLFQTFGQLLMLWQEIVTACLNLRERGITISESF